MKSKLTVVAHPETNEVFTPSKNATKAAAGWGTMRVDSIQSVLSNGLITLTKRTAFVNISKEALEFEGFTAGQALKGTIQRKKSFVPFYDGQESVINPETGDVTLIGGREFYQEFSYLEDPNVPGDIWVDDIVDANETANALQAAANGVVNP